MTTTTLKLFPKCRKLAYDARQQLTQVQNGILSAPDFFLTLEELTRQLDLMEELAIRETPAQRQVWKRKILELQEDARTIQRQAQQYDRMVHSNVRLQRERDELLTRRRRRKPNESDLNNLADEAQALEQSHLMMNDLLNSGEATMSSLSDQRGRLRGVRKTVMNISNQLGLTNATMRIIERRDVTDAYLVLAGCIITMIVIYICYFYFE